MRIIFNEMGVFSKKAFADADSIAHLKKLKNEADEAISDPSDVVEYADCLLALFGAAYKAGFTYTELFIAATNKLIVLKERQWEKLPDGTYQHIKSK